MRDRLAKWRRGGSIRMQRIVISREQSEIRYVISCDLTSLAKPTITHAQIFKIKRSDFRRSLSRCFQGLLKEVKGLPHFGHKEEEVLFPSHLRDVVLRDYNDGVIR